jgi:PAS domain S-box-containing protein
MTNPSIRQPLGREPLDLTPAHWSAVMNNLTEGLVIADAEGNLRTMNPAALRMLEFRSIQEVRRHLSQFPELFELRDVGGRVLPLKEWPLARALRGECYTDYEVLVRRLDTGTEWIASCGGTPVCDDRGETVLAIHTLRDVTAKRRAQDAQEESEALVRRVLDSLHALVGLMTPDGILIEANRVALEAAGLVPADVLGKRLDETHWWKGLPAAEQLREAIRSAAAGEPRRFEAEVRMSEGSMMVIDCAVVPLYDSRGRIAYLVPSAVDITERKRLEERLRGQAEQLEEADRRKNEFLAMLGHELRNPLAPIQNGVEIIRTSLPAGDTRANWALDMIGRQAHHLRRLVDDLLDVARITRGHIELRVAPVDLREIIAIAVDATKPLLDERHHELTMELPDGPIPVSADAVRIGQVLSNLLNNAAKYTPPGGRVSVRARREEDQAVIRVRDNGDGISPEVLPHIFDLFVQEGRTRERASNGLGLGLTLVRYLIERHGGSVQAHSSGPGQGSEFVIRLPSMRASAALPSAGGQARNAHAARRVLVVDDNPDVAASLAELLRLMGHEVHIAENGPRALELAQRVEPEVVFLDVGLPGMSGYEVARRLRERHKERRMILVTISGYPLSDEGTGTVDRHLLKPTSLESLVEVLDSYPGA